jgi:hypothetical protein
MTRLTLQNCLFVAGKCARVHVAWLIATRLKGTVESKDTSEFWFSLVLLTSELRGAWYSWYFFKMYGLPVASYET